MLALAMTSTIMIEVSIINTLEAPLLPSTPGIPPGPPLLSGVCPSPVGMTSPTGEISAKLELLRAVVTGVPREAACCVSSG